MARRAHNSRGFFGIEIDNGKNARNLGTIWRTAYNLGAAYTGQIGGRYHRESADTVACYRTVPHHVWEDPDDWYAHIPFDTVPVAIELTDDAESLFTYNHPNRAVYVLGPEDGNLRKLVLDLCRDVVQIPSELCLNQAQAAGMVMYDRVLKASL